MTEPDKTWEEWIRLVADEYGLNLDKDKETEKQKRILEAALHIFRNGDLKEPPPMPSPKKPGWRRRRFSSITAPRKDCFCIW